MIKQATINHIESIKTLFQETVLTVNLTDYSIEEVKDWASCGDDFNKWHQLFLEHTVYVFEQDKIVKGFCSINKVGHIHTFFVSKNHQRQGIAQQLLEHIETTARNNTLSSLTSEVSITAKPFFEKNGFTTITKQNAKANKLTLINYKMIKKL